jgi:gas vesicle protein
MLSKRANVKEKGIKMKDKAKKSSTGKIAAGAALIGIAGYVAGVLTAPKSGKETRKELKTAAKNTKTEAEKKLKAAHSELNVLLENGKKRAKDVSKTAKGELAEALQKAQVAKEKARDILSAFHEGDADDQDLQQAVQEVNNAIKHLKTFVKKEDAPKPKSQ